MKRVLKISGFAAEIVDDLKECEGGTHLPLEMLKNVTKIFRLLKKCLSSLYGEFLPFFLFAQHGRTLTDASPESQHQCRQIECRTKIQPNQAIGKIHKNLVFKKDYPMYNKSSERR